MSDLTVENPPLEEVMSELFARGRDGGAGVSRRARRSPRAFPTLLRVGFAEAVAYRAELLVWVLATTMPLVMLALWTAVARTRPSAATASRSSSRTSSRRSSCGSSRARGSF